MRRQITGVLTAFCIAATLPMAAVAQTGNIVAGNVGRLVPAWSVEVGSRDGHQESTPLIDNGVAWPSGPAGCRAVCVPLSASWRRSDSR